MRCILFMAICCCLFSQSTSAQLDTVKVYNVHCSYTDTTGDTTNFHKWGGNWTSFFPTEECPEPKEKYWLNHDTVMTYVAKDRPFWILLYNTNEKLIYEGLHYQNCYIGSFVVYHPNGKPRLRGQYTGVKWKKGEYKVTACEGKPTGTWIFYNLLGNVENRVRY